MANHVRTVLFSSALTLLSANVLHAENMAIKSVTEIDGLVALWTFQEAAGKPRKAIGKGTFPLREMAGEVARVEGGVFGPYAAKLMHKQWLSLARAELGALDINGKDATVSLVAWVKRHKKPRGDWYCEAVAGCWDEQREKRQYALFVAMPVTNERGEKEQVGGHISSVGGSSKGLDHSISRANGATRVPFDTWQTLGMTYDGEYIKAYINGKFDELPGKNPFHYPNGIFDGGEDGSPFNVGSVPRGRHPSGPGNYFMGTIGGIAVFDRALSDAEMAKLAAILPPASNTETAEATSDAEAPNEKPPTFNHDLGGTWYFQGRPLGKKPKHFGKAVMKLKQHGTDLSGEMWFVQTPNQAEPTPEGEDRHHGQSRIYGNITLAPNGRGTMVTFRRLNEDSDFAAIFTGTLNESGDTIEGWFVNNNPDRGMCRISRKRWPGLPVDSYLENLSMAKELLSSESSSSSVAADEKTIMAMADQFEQGLTQRDADKVLELFVNEDVPFVGPGKSSTELNNKKIGEFVRGAVKREELVEEKLNNRAVTVRGSTAALVSDYDYVIDGEIKGEGVETWTLIRTDRGWKILNASFGN